MPLTEKVTIRREVTYSKDRKHKFMLSIEWNDKLPKAIVVMIAPSTTSNNINNDLTTQLVVNNLSSLGYGGVYIANLVSLMGSKSMKITKEAEPYHKENFNIIEKTSNKDNIKAIILAWGSITNNNMLAKNLQVELLNRLSDKENMMYVIEDGRGKKGLHPLTPSVRNKWKLVPYFDVLNLKKESEVKELDY